LLSSFNKLRPSGADKQKIPNYHYKFIIDIYFSLEDILCDVTETDIPDHLENKFQEEKYNFLLLFLPYYLV